MNNYYLVEVKGHLHRFFKKCLVNNISLFKIDYLNDEQIIVKINVVDYQKIKQHNYYSQIRIIKYEGLNGVKYHLKRYYFEYLVVLLCFILMDVLTSYIVRIDIIHENAALRKLVEGELASHEIKPFRLAKDFNELEAIKNLILANQPNRLEWLSITRVGMTYLIRLEERIITIPRQEDGFAHLVSTKNALITKIISTRGSVLVRSGEYVRKGDNLISGEIKLYDGIKGNTLATGEVYGDVWYEVSIAFPLVYEEKVYTGKKRFNLVINHKMLFKNKYSYFDQKHSQYLKILGLKISFYEEVEYQIINKKYSVVDAEHLAITKVTEEMAKKLNNQGQIISKNVLQKETTYSTIRMRVFIITNELISTRAYYTPGSGEEDAPHRD